MRNSLEFTEDDLPRDLSQPEVVATHVRDAFDGETPVRIADVAHGLERNYGTCKTHLHRAAQMGLLTPVMRKGFLSADGPTRELKW